MGPKIILSEFTLRPSILSLLHHGASAEKGNRIGSVPATKDLENFGDWLATHGAQLERRVGAFGADAQVLAGHAQLILDALEADDAVGVRFGLGFRRWHTFFVRCGSQS